MLPVHGSDELVKFPTEDTGTARTAREGSYSLQYPCGAGFYGLFDEAAAYSCGPNGFEGNRTLAQTRYFLMHPKWTGRKESSACLRMFYGKSLLRNSSTWYSPYTSSHHRPRPPRRHQSTKRVGWTAEPDGRGSGGIILLSAVTTGTCVWTALHLNVDTISLLGNEDLVPPPNAVGKCLWAFMALIAPEMVSAVALHQALVALKYRHYVNTTGTGRKIGMLEAFFATMGGIAMVQVSRGRIKPFSGMDMEMSCIPPMRLDQLLEPDKMELVRGFSLLEIEARSKQDALAKFFVLSQAAWVLVQCVARSIGNLPVTPLELHTALYVVNLMVMYAAWWKKPVDLGRPMFMCATDGLPLPVSIVATATEAERPNRHEIDRQFHRSDFLPPLYEIKEGIVRCEICAHEPVNHAEGMKKLSDTIESYRELMIQLSEMRAVPTELLQLVLQEMSKVHGSANTEGGPRFTQSHSRQLRKTIRPIDLILISLQPDRHTWQQRLRSDLSARKDQFLYAISRSLIRNQLMSIPGLFSRDHSQRRDGTFSKGYGQDLELVWMVYNRRWKLWHRTVLLVFTATTGAAFGGTHATI
ncbi:hypothetical protein BZA05DRAFT_467523 [Tricharina praecox]|uniref:uncharacterized protein n=1 Tax=Tricharina praecox TaxID=43433 RepID=UPI00221F8898|nr:uncharacterized protein BZA05DRAFT_467523 [Tricharina praecox]KAI5854112.1 hypothetical protein BZA05DRAFT_467523 [Tricharina praecox]